MEHAYFRALYVFVCDSQCAATDAGWAVLRSQAHKNALSDAGKSSNNSGAPTWEFQQADSSVTQKGTSNDPPPNNHPDSNLQGDSLKAVPPATSKNEAFQLNGGADNVDAGSFDFSGGGDAWTNPAPDAGGPGDSFWGTEATSSEWALDDDITNLLSGLESKVPPAKGTAKNRKEKGKTSDPRSAGNSSNLSSNTKNNNSDINANNVITTTSSSTTSNNSNNINANNNNVHNAEASTYAFPFFPLCALLDAHEPPQDRSVVLTDHERRLLAEYEAAHGPIETDPTRVHATFTDADGTQYLKEEYESRGGDKTARAFFKALAACPAQCIRYDYAGEPLRSMTEAAPHPPARAAARHKGSGRAAANNSIDKMANKTDTGVGIASNSSGASDSSRTGAMPDAITDRSDGISAGDAASDWVVAKGGGAPRGSSNVNAAHLGVSNVNASNIGGAGSAAETRFPGTCGGCGSERVFEFQVMSQAAYVVGGGAEDIDWATAIIFSCPKSCQIPDNGAYISEAIHVMMTPQSD